ncbi:MAG TPA: hypothetical protein VK503_01540, partial [Candidatus Bathyarchaeia archaeon]|nr:hypothetical protein [Candidatus Bathyarchaeia archaeon]
ATKIVQNSYPKIGCRVAPADHTQQTLHDAKRHKPSIKSFNKRPAKSIAQLTPHFEADFAAKSAIVLYGGRFVLGFVLVESTGGRFTGASICAFAE